MSSNYDGLTRNIWPGTWSASAEQPIVLDTELRGALQSISGAAGDQLTNITGQRLNEGMIVYVAQTYTSGIYTRTGNNYYTYRLLPGQSRDINTGAMPNAEANWAAVEFGGGDSGYSGTSGFSGAQGFSGESGYSGVSGFSGESGYSGESGVSGFTGSSGYSGESGLSGYTGSSGFSGESGSSGISGYSGASGYSGEQGLSGFSGYVGFSGYSGFSGQSFSGEYVATVEAGVGVYLTGSSGTGAVPVINIGQPVAITDNVIFSNVLIASGGTLKFEDDIAKAVAAGATIPYAQITAAGKFYTNADALAGYSISDMKPGDFYYDDVSASIYICIDTGLGYYDLLDLTVRATL